MATIKQRRAMEKVLENHGNVGKSMLEAGYSPASAKNPKILTDSIGYKELCAKSGLTDKLIIKSLVEDIRNKPTDRVSELLLASKLLGLLDKAKQEGADQGKPIPIMHFAWEIAEKYGIRKPDQE